MPTYQQQRQSAADWMYSRRDQVDWWRWSVLTEHNPDASSLKLPPREAVFIFADLVQRGLLLPVVAPDGADAFTINPGRDAEWHALTRPRWTSIRGHGSTTIGYIISGVIGAAIALGLEHLIGK